MNGLSETGVVNGGGLLLDVIAYPPTTVLDDAATVFRLVRLFDVVAVVVVVVVVWLVSPVSKKSKSVSTRSFEESEDVVPAVAPPLVDK